MVNKKEDKKEDKKEVEFTTIRVRPITKSRLREYELYSREMDEEIIVRFLNKADREVMI